MKSLKKLMSIALTLILALALAAPALAEGSGSITITDSAQNQTYHAYRLLDLNENYDAEGNHYLYTLNSDWSAFFTEGAGKDYVELHAVTTADGASLTYVTWKEDAEASALAAAAKEWAEEHASIPSVPATSDANGVAEFTNLPLGYYLIDSTVGTTCFLDTTNPSVTIKEKNELPTLRKSIVGGTDTDGNGTLDKITASYGQTVTFEIAVKIPASAATAGKGNIVVTDTMSENLEFVDWDVVDGVTKSADGLTFTIDPSAVELDSDSNVTISYTATLKNTALTGTAIPNSAYLTYDGKNSASSTVNVYTYEFDLVKTRSDNTVLTGATFALYADEAKTTPVNVTLVGDVYVVDVSSPAAEGASNVIEAGKVTVRGLANGTYYLEETAAPGGYNRMTGLASIAITDGNRSAIMTGEGNNTYDPDTEGQNGLQVVNYTGAELPSTGGIGTTIFYVVGGLLVLGAVILLVTKKRMGGTEE